MSTFHGTSNPTPFAPHVIDQPQIQMKIFGVMAFRVRARKGFLKIPTSSPQLNRPPTIRFHSPVKSNLGKSFQTSPGRLRFPRAFLTLQNPAIGIRRPRLKTFDNVRGEHLCISFRNQGQLLLHLSKDHELPDHQAGQSGGRRCTKAKRGHRTGSAPLLGQQRSLR